MWTEWGYTIFGVGGQRDHADVSINLLAVDDANVKYDYEKIFYHDFPQVTEAEMGGSNANRKAIKMLQEGIRFDKDKQKYVSVLPWIKGRKNAASILNVLDSEGMAKRRVTQMMPRFDRDPVYKERVFKEMDKFLTKGFATPIPDSEMDPEIPRWYLPMHAVDKYNKIRMCHDARANHAVPI